MALPREYTSEVCPIARSLEIVGERWTLLIVRDAFYGVRRFTDFRAHLGIPKAVLAERLGLLVEEGVLKRVAGARGRDEYELTAKGRRLWPTIWSLINWGNENYLAQTNRRAYRHADCGGTIASDRVCAACGQVPDVTELLVHPPRRPPDRGTGDDPVSRTLRRPHRLLEPIEAG
ncbi:MAG: helix-turn-helix domain-containing protein [Mycobacterium sp.]|uniref:winged helix-turn-helix transcriptional regulator n=1 Tax=Mycobacterium sp. TaxID=1785 RepID=UPI003CC5F17F